MHFMECREAHGLVVVDAAREVFSKSAVDRHHPRVISLVASLDWVVELGDAGGVEARFMG